MTNNTGILGHLNQQKKQREQEAKGAMASANQTLATQTIATLKHLLKSPSAE